MIYQIIVNKTPDLFTWVWTPLVLPLFLGVGCAIFLVAHLLQRPLPEQARIGVLMLLAGIWWAVTYALELLSGEYSLKFFWARTQYIGSVLFPIGTWVMGVLYTDRVHWLSRRNLSLLTIIGFIICILVFTTHDHNLFWSNIRINNQTIPPTLQYDYQPGFWFYIVYASVLTWGGLGLMLFTFIRSPVLHRRQISIVIVSICVFLTATLLNIFNSGLAAYVDLQPYAVLVVCISLGWGIYRLQIGDIVPVAYLAVIESMPDAVIIINPHNRILKLNTAAKTLLAANNESLIGKSLVECFPQYPAVFSSKNRDNQSPMEIELDKHGMQRTYEIQQSPVLDGRGHTASQVVIIRDISYRVQMEKDLQERHRYLQALWESVPDAIVVLDTEKRVQEWSVGAEFIFDIPTASAINKQLETLTSVNPETGINDLQDTLWLGGTVNMVEIEIIRNDGKRLNVLASGSPIKIDDKLKGAVIVFSDITKFIDVEASLRVLNQELELRVAERTKELSDINTKLADEITQHQETELALVQRNRELLSFQAAATATASSLDIVFVLETLAWEMIDLLQVDECCVFQLVPNSDELNVIADYSAIIANEPTPERIINLKTNEIYRRVLQERFAKSIKKSEITGIGESIVQSIGSGNLLLLPMVFQDRVVGLVELSYADPTRELSDRQITLGQLLANQAAIAMANADLYNRAQQEIIDRQHAENQIKTSLKEKEMLLQEIHHRVKNNLQVISSLLSLQSRNVTDEETLTVLRESQDRIRSMALIHEKLYRSENLARIDFSSYLQSLTSHLVRSYRSSMGVARLQMDVADVSLSLETAVPCGLIVNELVSNALKHAFPDGQQGTIHITLSNHVDKQVSLTVADDGVGLPEGFDVNKNDSLGLRLVNMLIGQVRGELFTSNNNGATFRVVFPNE